MHRFFPELMTQHDEIRHLANTGAVSCELISLSAPYVHRIGVAAPQNTYLNVVHCPSPRSTKGSTTLPEARIDLKCQPNIL